MRGVLRGLAGASCRQLVAVRSELVGMTSGLRMVSSSPRSVTSAASAVD